MKIRSLYFLFIIIFALSTTHPVSTATASPASDTLSQINTQGWIAYIDQEQTVHVVHPDGSGDRAIYKIGHTIDSGEISLQGWSVNGRFLAFGVWRNDTRSIFVWDSRVESGLIELKGATALFGGVLWNPQEEHLFATIQTINKPGQSSRVNQLEIWNVLSTERVIVHPDAGYGFAWSPDGEQLFFDMPYMDTKTAGQAAPCPTMPTWVMYDGIYSYEVETESTHRVVTAKENPLHLDSVFPNGRELIVHEGVLLCTGMDGGCMQGQSYKVDLNHPDEWTSPFGSDCEWSPDGKLAACGGNQCGDDLIRIFDANGKNVQTLSQFQTAFPSPYYTKHWSPNNQLLSIEEIGWLTWSYNKNVWDSNSGEIEKIPGNVVYFDWSPDGKYYVACMTPENDLNCIFTIFDYETKTEVIRLGQGRGAYVDWQPQTLLDAPANLSIRPDAGKQTYIIEWDALKDQNVTYEVRYAFQDITESTWNEESSHELHGDAQIENGRIKLPVTIDKSKGGQSRSKIFIGVRAVNENGVYSPITNTPWIVDWGFRPDVNGYNFGNTDGYWKNETGAPTPDFTKDDMVFMFGEKAVCVQDDEPDCILTNEADTALENWTKHLAGGRCYGMAVTSGNYYKDDASVFEGVSSTDQLYNDLNIALARRPIAYYHVQQFTNPVTDQLVKDKSLTLQDEVDQLTALLEKGEGAVIALYNPDGTGGHAVTPIAVVRESNELYKVWVYDNNHPSFRKTPSLRSIAVNVSNRHWAYVLQDYIPKLEDLIVKEKLKLPNVLYGIGSSYFFVIPLNLHSEHAVFIGTNDDPPRYAIQAPVREGAIHLTIVDEDGHIIGYDQDTFVNQIEDADIQPVLTTVDSWVEPIYWLPAGSTYTVKTSPISTEPVQDILWSWIGDHFTILINRDILSKGDEFTVKDYGKELVYHLNEDGRVSLSFGQAEAEFETRIELQQYSFQAGDQLQIVYDVSEGDYLVTYSGKEKITGNLTMTLHDDQGEHVLQKENFQLQPENVHHVQVGLWSEQGVVRLGMDQNSDGQVEKWITERDEQGIFSSNPGLLWGGALILIGGFAVIIGVVILRTRGRTQR